MQTHHLSRGVSYLPRKAMCLEGRAHCHPLVPLRRLSARPTAQGLTKYRLTGFCIKSNFYYFLGDLGLLSEKHPSHPPLNLGVPGTSLCDKSHRLTQASPGTMKGKPGLVPSESWLAEAEWRGCRVLRFPDKCCQALSVPLLENHWLWHLTQL